MDTELDDLRGKAKRVQPDTIATRLIAYRAISDRAQTYADLLGMQQSTIAGAITELQAKARALLLSDDLQDAGGTGMLVAAQRGSMSLAEAGAPPQ